ncbi:MAG: PEGA domain-containing protein [Labilithrix sp.]|nr:PEGA domain-containing protein [Labilithrix sp.]
MRSNVLATLLFAVALAAGSAQAQAPPRGGGGQDLSRARALDREGAKAYGEGRYADAIRAFEEAYRLGGPAFELWNIAKCYLRLDQPEQAAASLERYLSIPDLPKADRAEATRQLEALEKRPSKLTVTSSPSGAQVSVDGESVEGRTPLSISVSPGPHTVTVSPESGAPFTREIDARYGRAVVVDAAFDGGARPPPPPNPYDRVEGGAVGIRGALTVTLPRHGSVGGRAGPGLYVLGTYRVKAAGRASLAAGGLLSLSGDSWRDRTGLPNEAPDCGPLRDPHRGTALSVFGIGTASFDVAERVRVTGIGGLGLAGYFVEDVGGDVFVPSCAPSPGVRPALLLGAQIDYALTKSVRLTAFPLTWQVQSAFDGTRGAPRDASGAWMRIGMGLGAGVDL